MSEVEVVALSPMQAMCFHRIAQRRLSGTGRSDQEYRFVSFHAASPGFLDAVALTVAAFEPCQHRYDAHRGETFFQYLSRLPKVLPMPSKLLLACGEFESVCSAIFVIDEIDRLCAVLFHADGDISQEGFVEARPRPDEVLHASCPRYYVTLCAEAADEIADEVATVGSAVQAEVFTRYDAHGTAVGHVAILLFGSWLIQQRPTGFCAGRALDTNKRNQLLAYAAATAL